MNKNELVSAVAEKAGLTKADAASAVDAVFETVQAELKNGGDIRLAGFGSFTVARREATTGRNPSTGAAVAIPARNVPKFTPGKGLKDAVNG
ncbi:MAG: DNA-binding protein HupB [Proteobacteria bacterium]|jgi:DNA-binding protein HU-beta|nr:DNA-binding protein HupB [Pseudomonadota bacterium]